MRTNVILGVASIAALVGTAAAAPVTGGDVIVTGLASNTTTAQLAHFNSAEGAALGLPGLRAQSGILGLGTLPNGRRTVDFGVNGSAVASGGDSTSGAAHAFYLGSAAGLNAAQGGVWFNTIGGGLTTVGANTTVLGFGNNPNAGGDFSSNTVIFNFNPGIKGFAFNFADIGDVANTDLVVRWSDGTEINVAGTNQDQMTGFFSLIAEAGRTIEQLRFRQTQVNGQDVNDGFLLYGFSTLTVVPLPPAAWAGLAMLGGVAGVRKLRRR
jgi:hypothetical protein